MTGRAIPEWKGRTPDSAIPPNVKLRILNSQRPSVLDLPICPECGNVIRSDITPDYDHRKPLADGGEHAERNLRAIHPKCHKRKTADEAHERALTRAAQMAAYGIRKRSKMQSAGFQKAQPQHTATTPPTKRLGYFPDANVKQLHQEEETQQ